MMGRCMSSPKTQPGRPGLTYDKNHPPTRANARTRAATPNEVGNSKSEARNPKQIQMKKAESSKRNSRGPRAWTIIGAHSCLFVASLRRRSHKAPHSRRYVGGN